jgi:hypothetical protein
MPTRLRVSADTLTQLRDFLTGADVDMGCRPFAVKRGGRYATTVISDEHEIERLSARLATGIQVEVLEVLPDPASRLRMIRPGNRFLRGGVPRGLGVKVKP